MSKIADTHPELFHYTTAAGLSGIIKSKSLWATHSSFVNDSEEIYGFYDRILPAILFPILLNRYEEIGTMPEFQKKLEGKTINSYCKEQLAQFINILKTVSSTMHDHYITSFSIPGDEWIRKHGLLSQWRAYGPDGGYAIVFDTTTFDEILSTETSSYQEEFLTWADVQYHLNENRRTDDPDIDQWIEKLEIAAGKFFRSESEQDGGDLATPLTVLSSMFKHRGFEEEREVRFVLSLLGPRLEAEPELHSVRQHPIKTKIRMGEAIPYVELCVKEVDGVRKHLPIKRIIVGPHRDKNDRKRAIQLLLKEHDLNPDMVTVSDIPYRG